LTTVSKLVEDLAGRGARPLVLNGPSERGLTRLLPTGPEGLEDETVKISLSPPEP
jgi:hypothetical protein